MKAHGRVFLQVIYFHTRNELLVCGQNKKTVCILLAMKTMRSIDGFDLYHSLQSKTDILCLYDLEPMSTEQISNKWLSTYHRRHQNSTSISEAHI